MPIYDYKCANCGRTTEAIMRSNRSLLFCECGAWAERQLSAPAGIRMGDGSKARKAQRIKEPTWVYPDGHRESLNSANTRPEESGS